jgi:hypothetical protein
MPGTDEFDDAGEEWRKQFWGSDASAKADTTPKGDSANPADAEVPCFPMLAKEAFHGPVGEIVRTVAPHTESDPALLLVGGLAYFGNVLGRGPHTVVEGTSHSPNFDVLFVGETSKSRKGTGDGRLRQIFKIAAPAWCGYRIKSGLSSGEGLINEVRDPVIKMVKGEEKIVDEGVDDKRLLIVQSEFGGALNAMKREGSLLSAVLRDAWDGRDLATLVKQSPLRATNPHISVIGHVTKSELVYLLDQVSMANGLANRFMFCCVKRSKLLPFGGALDRGDVARLGAEIGHAIERAGEIGEVTWSRGSAQTLVFCDFETRKVGGCDLKVAGAWRYATEPTTEVLCFGYRIGGVDYSWSPTSNSPDPLERLAADRDVAFACFGGFEQAVWQKIMVERHGFPPIPTGRWIDLRATCSSLALPRSLDKALAALSLPIAKDKGGQRLVRSLSRPDRKTGLYPALTPAIVERVAAYNKLDILALEAIHKQGLGRLNAAEQAVWELDQKINGRGIAIDVEFVEAAKRIADQVMGEAVAEFTSLTRGVLPSQVQKIREWLRDNRCALPNLEAETVSEALETPNLPDNVRRVLEIRQITAAMSLKKLDAMLACVGPDGRARGLLQYHGATTGRWSGQLIQPHNFPRSTLEVDVDPEDLATAVKTGDPDALSHWGKPIDVLVSSLRCALTAADGATLTAGDFSMIEACVLLALAGQHDKCALIAQGVDVYRDMAATIYGLDRKTFMGVPEDQLSPEQTEQRRIGKNGVLSSGFGIGAEGFYRRFCRHVEGGKELAARIVAVYRNQWAPAVPLLWRDLERTARRAMLRPNMTATADCGVAYRLTTRVGLPCLICEPPGGKLLHYRQRSD